MNLKKILNCFFSCLFCHKNVFLFKKICSSCEALFVKIPVDQSCVRCLLPLKKIEIANDRRCGRCLNLNINISYDQILSPFYYNKALSRSISAFKFKKNLSIGKYLTEQLIAFLEDKKIKENYKAPDLIIPVPLHRKRLFFRGFNQSYLIAKWVSKNKNKNKKFKIKIDNFILKRVHYQRPQLGLTRKKRKENILNNFELDMKKLNKNKPKSVAVVDDVVTTGATMEAICLLLKKAGIERVDIWCLARTKLS